MINPFSKLLPKIAFEQKGPAGRQEGQKQQGGKIKSITWQTTLYLCGNLLFYDCVQRVKIKCIIFPFTATPSQFYNAVQHNEPIALPLPFSIEYSAAVSIYEDLCARLYLVFEGSAVSYAENPEQ